MDRRLLALALLAALAGCGSVIGTDDPGAVTPAPVATPEPATDAGPREIAPGVTTEGIQDVDELFEAHLALITNSSYVWAERYREEGFEERGSFRVASTRTMAFEARGDGYRHRSERRRTLSGEQRVTFRRARYGTEQVTYELQGTAGSEEAEYRRLNGSRSPRTLALPNQPVRHVIILENQTVARADVGERPHFLIEGSRPAIPDNSPVEDVRSRVIVREDGLVRRVNVSFVSPVYGDPVPNQYTVTYSNVGNTTVEAPPWLPDARAAVGD